MAEALKEMTIFLRVGSADARFLAGSEKMAEAFKEVGADLTYFEVPGRGHDVWFPYLGRPAFYDWLLNDRGSAAAQKDRASAERMLNWAVKPPDDPQYRAFVKRLEEAFSKFAPWWHIENCARVDGAGLHAERLGRENVFVTHPLNGNIPCRMMIMAEIPEDEATKPRLEVGHADGQQWELRVYVNSRRRLREVVGKEAAEDENWHAYEVDLSEYAGKEVLIEVLSEAHGCGDGRATRVRIERIREPVEGACSPPR